MTTKLTGKNFPAAHARTLSGEEVTLDQFFSRQELTFFSIGFTYESQYQITPWVKEIEKNYHDKIKSYTMAVYDMVWSKLARGWIDGAMVRGTNHEEQEQTLTTTEDALIKRELGITDKNLAYFYLVDKNNTILWSASGPLTTDGLKSLGATIDQI
jgi:hypothetical protein